MSESSSLGRGGIIGIGNELEIILVVEDILLKKIASGDLALSNSIILCLPFPL